jgi:AsmA protein
MKILKYALIALAGLVVLAGAVAAYVAATFDPNQYKPQIIQAVKDKTQRTLKLEGDIKLTFFPSIGASLGKASLTERGSDREFAAVEEARVSLKLLPLLSKQAVVDKITIKGLRANYVKTKDAKSNVDDLIAPEPASAPSSGGAEPGFGFDIAGVELTDATIHYTDQAAGKTMTLSKLNLKTGRVTPGVPTDVELSIHAQGDKPKLDLQTSLKTRVAFDPGKSVALENMTLDAKGTAAGIANLVVKAAGNLTAGLKSGEYTASKLTAAMTGDSGKDKLDVKLDAPKLAFAADKASGEKVMLVAKITGPEGATSANLTVPGVEGTSQSFKTGPMALELDMKKGGLSVKARIDSPLEGNIKGQQFNLPQLKASLTATGPDLPGKTVSGQLTGSAGVDLARENARADIAGKIGDSTIKGQVGVGDFSPLRLTFNLDIDQLDVDRYLSQQAAASGQGKPGQKPAAPAAQKPDKPFDLSGLKELNATGTLRIGSLKVNNVKASNVKLDLKAANGHADLSPLTANFYQGTLSSAISINAAPATPTFAVKHSMSGISVGPFLHDLASNDTLEGKGNVTVDVTTQGNTVGQLKKSLAGSAGMKLADGAVKGIDIAGSIRNAKAKLGALRGEHTQQADKSQKTDFSELTATFQIKNGVAHNQDLSMKSPLLRVEGNGDVNIGEDSINYLVKASIVGTLKGQGGRDTDDLKGLTVPVRLSGPLDAPSYKLDFAAMVTDSVKQSVKEQLQKRLGGGEPGKKDGGSGGSVKDKLKGLLGR